MKLAAIQHEHHTGTHQHEQPRADEPGQHGHAEVVGAQAEVELVGGHRDDTRRAGGKGFALQLGDMTFADHGRRAHQNRREVVLTHAPAEREERIDEHQRQAQQLDFRHALGGLLHHRDIRQQRYRPLGRPEHRENTRQDNQRAGGEERGVALQIADHAGIGDAVVTQQHAAHPVFAIQVQNTGQARGVTAFPCGIAGVTTPADDKPDGRQNMDQVGLDKRHAGPCDVFAQYTIPVEQICSRLRRVSRQHY
ncbi:hypothetical protein D3C84_702330 [compost metagenome]